MTVVDHALMARIDEFSRRLEDASSTRRLPTPLGPLLLNDDFPLSYAHNFLRVEEVPSDLTPERLTAEARAAFSTAGRTHLQVVLVADEPVRPLVDGLRGTGWEVSPIIAMAWRRPPDRAASVVAELAPWEAVRPLVERGVRQEPYATSEEVVRQLVDRRCDTARATNLRHVVAPAGGPYTAHADLYSDGTTAQVENVVTLAEHRNGGLARAVVLHAAELARAEGHDLVFLFADEGDWPRELYRRLGFDTIGRFWELSRD